MVVVSGEIFKTIKSKEKRECVYSCGLCSIDDYCAGVFGGGGGGGVADNNRP